jgi:cytochrome c556
MPYCAVLGELVKDLRSSVLGLRNCAAERNHAMKRVLVGIAALAIISCLAPGGFGEPREDVRDFMRVKLKHSQKVLEGLVMEDFDVVARNAQDMSLLSLAASWQVLQTPQYLDHSRKFRSAADTLTEMARKHNLDAATSAYNKLTVRCIECHKYVRDVRMVKLDK